jgi:TonB family protein
MRLSRIALPILLAFSVAACAANAGAAASAGAAGARAESRVALQNRAQSVQLMLRNYPPLMRDARVTGEVFVQVTLDAAGAVTDSRVTRSTLTYFDEPALKVADQLRFTPPAAAGQRVDVRMLFAEQGQATISVVD